MPAAPLAGVRAERAVAPGTTRAAARARAPTTLTAYTMRPCRRARLSVRMEASAGHTTEVRICTGKVCKKQGSEQIVRFGEQLGLPGLQVTAGGCLGNCGNGPNLVLLPQGQVLRHVTTPANLAHALRAFCGAEVGDNVLRATELRLAGNALATAGDLRGAVERYEEALRAAPGSAGAYLIHCNLSATRLQLGDKEAAASHARLAVEGAPRGFHKAHVRLIDALYASGQYAEAEVALGAAVASDPAFKGLQEYKMIVKALRDAKQQAHA